ncbi:uncharacterized protein LOC126738756 [Anthonomus grandis grandis]|uniref:uncharacterized protein LOC126738756 n=1 Tax=Anthonomus grandis grandis TaxID=2921223 RepID=UPI002165FA4A|nr:uncharacterized protein LOC126738756 [Anthonomus grandis grandis]
MANKMLNSTKPVKMWIDGKIFQIRSLNNRVNSTKKKRQRDQIFESQKLEIEDNFEHLNHLDIRETAGKFITNMKLPMQYYTKISKLNFDFHPKTELVLPDNTETQCLTIQSDSKNKLLHAVTHVHSAISEIRIRHPPMHFTCIPCISTNILERFESLKKEILTLEGKIEDLHESIFISPLKLHVTIDVYALLDEHEKAEAVKALHEYVFKFLDNTKPPKLKIQTLECMGKNVKKTDVIYAKVNLVNESDEHDLQKIVNDISDHFYHRGLARKHQENVKIHMTIINTKYRKNVEGPKSKRRRQSIDATKILELFKHYDFGECDFDSIHLSNMTLKGEDGFYKPLAVIKVDNLANCNNSSKENKNI